MLRSIFLSLGGLVLVATANLAQAAPTGEAPKEPLARHFVPRDWHELEDGSVMLEERTIAPGWDAIESRWLLFRDGKRHERSIRERT